MAYGKYWTHVAEHPVYIIYNYNGQSMYVEACGIVVLLQRRPNGTPSSVGERLYLHDAVQVVLVSFALVLSLQLSRGQDGIRVLSVRASGLRE
jgi:hypothetical protein